MSDPHSEVEASGFNRRSLIKKMAVGAFAVPAIVSFELDSLARAGTFSSKPPKHTYPNQSEPNQHPKPPKDCDPPKHHDPDPKPPKHHDPDPPKHHDPDPPKHHDPDPPKHHDPKPPKHDKQPKSHESKPPKPPKKHKPDHKSKPT